MKDNAAPRRVCGVARIKSRKPVHFAQAKGRYVHYRTLVIIEKPDDSDSIEEAVKAAMKPGFEDWWDWFQIGGRWTGTLDGYEPGKDPANLKPCEFCEATGTTTEAVAQKYPAYREHVGKPCIQCNGTGQAQKWPTEWKRHEGDVRPVESLTAERYEHFYRIVVDGETFTRERYESWHQERENRFIRQKLPPLEWLKERYNGHLAVVVDYHN